MKSICIDFGGTNIKAGILNKGEILAEDTIPALSSKPIKERFPDVEKLVFSLLKKVGSNPGECCGVGLAFPGLVNTEKNKILLLVNKYPDALEVDFNLWAERSFGLPLIMENDAHAALLGEYGFGCARGALDSVMLILGTGLGTSAIINGRIIRGKHFQAGCLAGHFITRINGRECGCGSRGCFETEASTAVLPRMIKEHPLYEKSFLKGQRTLDYKTLKEGVDSDDSLAIELFESSIDYWSAVIVNLVHAYDPETVIISGGVMNSKEYILPRIIEKVKLLSLTPWGELTFKVPSDPDKSVLLGLNYLIEKRKKNEVTHRKSQL